MKASFVALALILSAFAATANGQTMNTDEKTAALIARVQKRDGAVHPYDALFPPRTKLLESSTADGRTRLVFNTFLGWRRWYPAEVRELHALLGTELGVDPDALEILIRYPSGRERFEDVPLSEHVTSAEAILARESGRTVNAPALAAPVVQRVDYAGPAPENGLLGRNLVIAPSHGWTWHKEQRWQFQRCRLHTTVEDLYTLSYAYPFLMPMLENAGAVVYSAKERDTNTNEVIVDNDGVTDKSRFELHGVWTHANATGWRGGRPAMVGDWDEPFRAGTVMQAEAGSEAHALYVPYIPEDGRYSVYVSWAQSSSNSASVPVTVRHLGGETTFRVNQQVSGNTWVLLGFFEFAQGADAAKGAVRISAQDVILEGEEPQWVTIDAVRFGGGMGNAAPGGTISNKPRYAEAARYFLQYSGAPADAIFHRDTPTGHFGPEYSRDYYAKSEWPNYLMGAPSGPNGGWRNTAGLGVPVDLYLAWHTDAGVSHDGLIGTHLIYSVTDAEGNTTYPDGRSRWLGRDLATLIDDEIARSARELYTSTWQRRHIHNRSLAETSASNVPTALIELLAHQNMNDMKYGLDPRFKFDISRAVYKALLRFVAATQGYEPVIQPLPPTHLSVKHIGGGTVEIAWREQPDPLEPSANAQGYIVYTSSDGRAFDNGTYVTAPRHTVEVPENETTYFRVTATNAGGESFPSRVAGVRWANEQQAILIVDGFDRVSGPAFVENETTAGFDRDIDPGVGWHWNYGLVGNVYDYDRASDWQNDLDSPGWGASDCDWEDRLEKGNSFDHIVAHGEAAAAAGLAFDSALSEAYADRTIDGTWPLIDWIAGLQRSTPPPAGMPGIGNPDRMTTEFEVLNAAARERLQRHAADGGKLLLSGAYIAEDLLEGPMANDASRTFARNVLGIASYEAKATRTNAVLPSDSVPNFDAMGRLRFGAQLGRTVNQLPVVMSVPSAETFGPGPQASVAMTYGDSGKPAAIASADAVVLGFPLETILPVEKRAETLKAAAAHLGVAQPK